MKRALVLITVILLSGTAYYAFAQNTAQAAAEFLVERGFAHHDKGNLDSAIADFGRAILLNPVFAAAYVNRGFSYSEKGDFDKAIADFEAGLEFEPGNTLVKQSLVMMYISRGLAFSENGDIGSARRDFEAALEIHPNHPMAKECLDALK